MSWEYVGGLCAKAADSRWSSSRKCQTAAAGGCALLQHVQIYLGLLTYCLFTDSQTISDAAIAAVQPQARLACELHDPAAVADHAAGHRGRPPSQGGSLQQVMPLMNFCSCAGINYFVSLPALANDTN